MSTLFWIFFADFSNLWKTFPQADLTSISRNSCYNMSVLSDTLLFDRPTGRFLACQKKEAPW